MRRNTLTRSREKFFKTKSKSPIYPVPHRLYSNENFPLPAVELLRHLGHDVVTILEDGLANRSTPDATVLERATALQRAVLTLNRHDFRRLHVNHQNHAGIVVCTADRDAQGLAQRIHEQVNGLPALEGQLVVVQRGN